MAVLGESKAKQAEYG